jgi:hypothetical protein
VTLTYEHERSSTFGLPDGTQPLKNAGQLLLTAGPSIQRTRLQVELYVEAVSSTGNLVNFLAMTATRAAVGVERFAQVGATATPHHPLSDPILSGPSPIWLAWSPAHPTVDFFKESDVETAVWTYRTDPITLDVQTRRDTPSGDNLFLFWSYEITEDSGTAFINQVVGGTTYALGWRVYYDYLISP